MIGRFAGRGLYIGRDLRLTVTRIEEEAINLRIEGLTGTVVTDSDLDLAGHLVAVEAEERRMGSGNPALPRVGREYIVPLEAGLWIGRDVTVQFVELCDGGKGCRCRAAHRGTQANLAIEAPMWMAVSRDDFSFTDHMRWQEEREKQRRVVGR